MELFLKNQKKPEHFLIQNDNITNMMNDVNNDNDTKNQEHIPNGTVNPDVGNNEAGIQVNALSQGSDANSTGIVNADKKSNKDDSKNQNNTYNLDSNEQEQVRTQVYKTAQENMIAALLRLPDRAMDVVSMLNEDDFSDASCRLIFIAIRNMVKNNDMDNFNIDTLQVELELEGNLIAAGGQQRLVQLLEKSYMSASIATIDTYARLIKDVSTKKQIKKTLEATRKNLFVDSGSTARQVIERTQSALTQLSGNLETSKMAASLPEYFDDFIADLKNRVNTYRSTDGDELAAAHGIPTGFETLDKKLHGWQPGNTIIVGARTGVGKSVCAIDFSLAAAYAGSSVLFFSMEMTLQEIMQRYIACLTGVSINKLATGDMNDEQLEEVMKAKKKVDTLKIKVDTSQDSTIEYIMSTASKQAQSETGLDLVIIDYLGLIKYTGKRDDKQNQTADISRALKEMAMTMQIPVIALVQLDNRVKGEEADEEPTLAYIRDSGAIANDANVIILLHRRKDETKTLKELPTKFIIEKNRGGEKGSFMCHSFLWRAKFQEISKDGDGSFDDEDEINDASNDSDNTPNSNAPVPSESSYSDEYDEASDDDDIIDDNDVNNVDDINDINMDDDDEAFDELFG